MSVPLVVCVDVTRGNGPSDKDYETLIAQRLNLKTVIIWNDFQQASLVDGEVCRNQLDG